MTWHNAGRLFKHPKNYGILLFAGLLVFVVFAGGGLLFNQISRLAKASSQTTLYPGQTGEFTVSYINAGDADVTNANISIDIGPKLEFIPGSIKELFGTETTPRCVNDNVVVFTTTNNVQAATINYTPNSATTTTNPCDGHQGTGSATIPAVPGANPTDTTTWPANKTGKIIFRAKLRDSNTDAIGYVIGQTALDPAVSAVATFDGQNGGRSDAQVVVAGRPSNQTNLTPSEAANITYACQTASINSTTTCNFTLPSGKTLPSDFKMSVGNANPGGVCVASSSAVVCGSVPTGAVSGSQPIRIQTVSTTNDSGQHAVLTSILTAGSNILYFVGADNTAPCYNQTVRYNTCYSRTQKFKDGPVSLIFDNLKKSDSSTLTSGTCTFKLSRYPKDQDTSGNIIRTYTSAVSSGKCVATLPVADQTVNYYMVTASVLDGNSSINDASVLVLYVGG